MEEVDEAAVDPVETEAIGVELQQFIAEVTGKVRRVMKMFRKSPLKDEILQKHIQAQLNAELKLILDSKTKWNSLLEMIKNVSKWLLSKLKLLPPLRTQKLKFFMI